MISIHALLAESDLFSSDNIHPNGISIHALLAESDDTSMPPTFILSAFLSTLSLRRATLLYAMGYYRHGDFYPRSPCGERRVHYDNYNLHCVISIHALLAESDETLVPRRYRKNLFLSTLSLRRATCRWHSLPPNARISIHALLAESDPPRHWHGGVTGHFYPRSPCGERQSFRSAY